MPPRLPPLLRRAGLLALAPLALLLPLLSPVQRLDLALLDLETRLLRAVAPRPAPALDPVLIGIDEATYRALPEPFALWHGHLGRLLEGLAEAGSGPVGLDIVFPDRSFDGFLPGQDRLLLRGLLAQRRAGGVVLGITVDERGTPRPIHPPFLSAAGPEGRAFVLWRLDEDRVVRRVQPHLEAGRPDTRVLVAALLQAMGRTPQAGLIDYTVGPAWTYLPLHTVLDRLDAGDTDWLRAQVAGRPVLVGTVLPFEDRRLQPVALAAWEPHVRDVPGVLIHAQALRAQLAGRVPQEAPAAVPLVLSLLLLGLWYAARRPWTGAAAFAVTASAVLAAATAGLAAGFAVPVAAPLLAAGLAVAGRATLESVVAVAEKNRLRSLFSGYVSPDVLRDLLTGRADAATTGRRHEVCLLFSDIRGFTTLSEGLEPEAVVTLLNRYFEEMVQAIHGQGGTVDKFIGDGLMAFFGAPQALDNPAASAFAAAKDMLARLTRLNAALTAEGQPPLHIGIGLHLGAAVIGNIGPAERHEYTAIGDAVNTCSRVEGLTKTLGCALLVTDRTAQAIGPGADLVSLGEVPVKGRAPVRVHGWAPALADSAPPSASASPAPAQSTPTGAPTCPV